jgi:CBS domain containing-hemolysin-like protein
MLQVLISFLLVFFGFCAAIIIAITTVSCGNKHLNLADEGGNARFGDFGVEMRGFSRLNHAFGFILYGLTVCLCTFADATVELDLVKCRRCSLEVFNLGWSFLVVFANLKLCFSFLHFLFGLHDKLLDFF